MGELEQLLAGLQPLLANAFGGGAPSAGGTPGQGQPQGGGPGWLDALLQMQQVMGATQAGNQQQELMKKIAAMQMMAAQRAMAFNPARFAQNAIRDTLPINRQLAYQVGQAEDSNLAAKGMDQSPGATAAGQAAALAPYAQQNQEMGQRMALAGAQIGQNGLQFPFSMSSPDYLQTLNELGTLGQNSAFPGSR